MEVIIKFKVDNQAFEDSPEAEVKLILGRALKILFDGGAYYHPGGLMDSNGNTVGSVDIETKED